MTTRQQKIDAIYEKIARKWIEPGCKLKDKLMNDEIVTIIDMNDLEYCYCSTDSGVEKYLKSDIYDEEQFEVIGAPVTMGDAIKQLKYIADWHFYRYIDYDFPTKIARFCRLWEYEYLPLERQPEKCIDFIFDLISK